MRTPDSSSGLKPASGVSLHTFFAVKEKYGSTKVIVHLEKILVLINSQKLD